MQGRSAPLKVRLVLNTDTHGPNDLISLERALKIALGAGLDKTGFEKIRRNAAELLEKTSV
jgi:histidinol phosphatase-like PHP family hydrolase